MAFSRSFSWRKATMDWAFRLSVTTSSWSPGSGSAARPRISTGVDGPGLLQPLAVVVDEGADLAGDRARHDRVADAAACRPARARWPPGRGPCRAAPRARCRRAGFLGLALSSCRSATRRSISRSCSRFCFFLAETFTKTVVPPHSSGMSPRSESCCFTRSGWASGLSILLTATTMGTPAALAWSMASTRLGHDAVVRGHHQDDDVRDLGAAGAHQGEGLVAGRVEEDDLPRARRPRGRRRCAG